MASLLDYLQNPGMMSKPEAVQPVQTQLPGYTPTQFNQPQPMQQQQQQGMDLGQVQDAYKLGKNMSGLMSPAASTATMPATGVLNPAAYSQAMNAGPAMQAAGVNMQGLTAGMPGMGGAAPAAAPASGGVMGALGPAAAVAGATYGADKFLRGGGQESLNKLGGKNLPLGDLGRGIFSQFSNPGEAMKGLGNFFTLGLFK